MQKKLFTLPNLVTLANLACGCAAVVFAFSWGWPRSVATFFWLVAAAAVFDFADGMVARLTGQYSEIGKQLDSLADMVSFGVAPSVALFSMYLASTPLWKGAPAGIYEILGYGVFAVALFSALRLAKFNVDDDQKEEFTGLPTPAAALAIVSLHRTAFEGAGIFMRSEVILVLAVVVSWLLVSPVRMFSLKFKGFGWRSNQLQYTFLALSAVLIAMLGIGGVAACIGLYIAMSVARQGVHRGSTRKNDRFSTVK